jgi:hypothetical protein
MSVSLERLARNQTLFREVNERLLELANGSQAPKLDFVCECSNEECTETLAMKNDEYESVRAHSTHFVVTTGHEILQVEEIVERSDGYTVVRKIVEREFVAETDPRRAPE